MCRWRWGAPSLVGNSYYLAQVASPTGCTWMGLEGVGDEGGAELNLGGLCFDSSPNARLGLGLLWDGDRGTALSYMVLGGVAAVGPD